LIKKKENAKRRLSALSQKEKIHPPLKWWAWGYLREREKLQQKGGDEVGQGLNSKGRVRERKGLWNCFPATAQKKWESLRPKMGKKMAWGGGGMAIHQDESKKNVFNLR